MLTILAITFPIYAIIALGYIAVRQGVFKPEQMPVFGGYVLNIALPALLFNAVATRDVGDVFNLTYMAVFLVGALATIAIAYLAFTALGISPSRRAVAIMGTTCPNSGFVGYPVMLLAFPGIAGQILALNMLVENFVIIPICLALMEASKAEDAHILRKLRNILWGVLKRPMVLALLAGLAVSISGIEMPAPVLRVFGMLAASASALALFVIGGALVGVPFRGNRATAVQIVLGKLLLHPVMVFLALIMAPMIGFAPLPPDLAAAVVISAAIPMFSVYALFAQELGHEGMASIAQILATSLAFFTLSALLFVIL
ncbi:AEC family transporter [Alisedimentitalea sp. MJ-SS2]|uniref:AEC family transporter n=1 Tax=Aliisedimentitalea sp. MJ-SS2 TaxID=3049795 RepID=UPI0029125701|nr:AEC family transporter [Alisedimentitalea sp. MJ-SS2]MDU8927710.1 AEC family transporter [Alisedimentitalea sp. MJ-SS2]